MARLLQARGVRPAFILDEGGNISQPFSLTRKPFATVGVAEKGRLLFSLSCTAPRALEELSRAATRISRIHPRARLCDPVLSDMLPAMRPLMNGRDRFCLSHGRLFHGSLLHRLSRTATGRAITRTQLSLWKQSGDALLGEIPTLHYSASILPGDSAEALLRQVRRCIRRAPITLSVQCMEEPGALSPASGPAWDALCTAIAVHFPGTVIVPLAAGRRHGRAAHGSALPAGVPLQPLHPAAGRAPARARHRRATVAGKPEPRRGLFPADAASISIKIRNIFSVNIFGVGC